MVQKREICFKVFRFDPDRDSKPYFQTYQVPFVRKDLTVLEGLFYIQEKLDNSLAFRSSCRSAVCGSCAMHINGRYGLACNTLISSLKGNKVTQNDLYHMVKQTEGKIDIVKYLVSVGANINPALETASKYGHLDTIKFLVEKSANIHSRGDAPLR